jgi:hypothetical protein
MDFLYSVYPAVFQYLFRFNQFEKENFECICFIQVNMAKLKRLSPSYRSTPMERKQVVMATIHMWLPCLSQIIML